MDDSNEMKRLLAYERFFGPEEPRKRVSQRTGKLTTTIHAFPPKMGRDYWALATNGMSDIEQSARMKMGLPARTEIVLFARAVEPWMSTALARMSERPFSGKFRLGQISIADGLLPESAARFGELKKTLLLPLASSNCPARMSLYGFDVELLLMAPIADAEFGYARCHGARGLFERLRAAKRNLVIGETLHPVFLLD